MYRVFKGSSGDTKKSRVFVIVSRQVLIDSKYSTVICAPIYSARHGLSTQVPLGIDEGLKHDSSIHCDELVSIQKSGLKDYVGTLSQTGIKELNIALASALEIL